MFSYEYLGKSRQAAQIRNGLIFGDTWTRIGDPFRWIDGEGQGNLNDHPPGIIPLLQWILTYYELYDTPADLRHEAYDRDFDEIHRIYKSILNYLVPFGSSIDGFDHSVLCNATCRVQDLSFIADHKNSISGKIHLDFGAGLGGPSIYSNAILGCRYIAIEAQPYTYSTQKLFLPQVLLHTGSASKYVDLLELETIQSVQVLQDYIYNPAFSILQLPSWNWSYVKDHSVGLISSSWCLNELNTAAIFWFLANSIRTLEPQGFIYIRDSGKLKPGRHSINYDEFFLSQGFELIKSSSYVNRKEIWGVPRIYQRTSFSSFSPEYTFEYLYDQVLGRYAMTSTGEDLRQGYSPSL